MKRPIALLLCLSVWGVAGKVDHAEKRGEHPAKEDVDSGQCVPIPCFLGQPTPKCKRLCDLRGYETICQPPADFCLCRHKVHGKWTLVSPDEVMDQPPDSEEEDKIGEKSAKSSKATDAEEPKVSEQPEELPKVEEETVGKDEELVSFQIFTVLLPIKQYLYETWNEEDPKPTADTVNLGYEPVNVHEGRLFWDFRYILTGLLILMIGLVVYELILCVCQVYRPKQDLERCEPPSVVKVIPPLNTEKEKILQV